MGDSADADRIVRRAPRSPTIRFFSTLLGIELYEVDQVEVLEIALDTGLSTYDASYLWLSRRLSIPLVTLDQRLARLALEK